MDTRFTLSLILDIAACEPLTHQTPSTHSIFNEGFPFRNLKLLRGCGICPRGFTIEMKERLGLQENANILFFFVSLAHSSALISPDLLLASSPNNI